MSDFTPVSLSADLLLTRDAESEAYVLEKVSQAFGAGGAGLLLVKNLRPCFVEERARLYDAAINLAALSQAELTPVERPEVAYTVGWSRGRERFRGSPDILKGSFYANPVTDTPVKDVQIPANVDLTQYSGFLHENIWPLPGKCPDFEKSFKHVGSYMHDVGLQLACFLDKHVRKTYPAATSLYEVLCRSRNAKGRLLHYFPPSTLGASNNQGDFWCGFHNDHGTLTALLSGEFVLNGIRTQAREGPPTLRVVPDGGEGTVAVRIPQDAIAFQLGEAAQIASGGVLRATAHAVARPKEGCLARVAFALFMQPNPWEKLTPPSGVKCDALDVCQKVPTLRERYCENDTFAKFAEKTVRAYVNE